ncbi:MAG TPA: 4Fe-4S dicluster domain-containing protein [Bacteroidales bacterium]|mgnify:FL=1|jgi:heterodisulfide reductase subunit C|nr:4Fe-4S dicluster domain-containing protein [Bacteroidales bacterium]NLK54149.1 4Fe-4S dicluster domain-containing protein [Bacteroidales bacterium]HNY52036.1 4Fe-4S dicluster domain-containing protein [Bacteroidales bacterium]HOG55825.1 4Fe-4S dicluster domain-containing protein [Bacteroidales bacterium]HPB12525.1 4Fe-4S dicluster domain-containing protein [Bacteroidales bacterium]
MEKFGFSLSKARVINYDANDRGIVRYIIEREPSLKLCIECGCCTATCTTGNFTDFSLREIHILLKRGENEQVREKIRKCMLCGKCILVCPRGVNTRNVISVAKQAFRKTEGYEL